MAFANCRHTCFRVPEHRRLGRKPRESERESCTPAFRRQASLLNSIAPNKHKTGEWTGKEEKNWGKGKKERRRHGALRRGVVNNCFWICKEMDRSPRYCNTETIRDQDEASL